MEIGIFDHVISTFFMAFMATLVKWPKQHKNIAAPTGLHLAFSRGTISLLLTTENIFHVPISILAKREAGVNPARSRHCNGGVSSHMPLDYLGRQMKRRSQSQETCIECFLAAENRLGKSMISIIRTVALAAVFFFERRLYIMNLSWFKNPNNVVYANVDELTTSPKRLESKI